MTRGPRRGVRLWPWEGLAPQTCPKHPSSRLLPRPGLPAPLHARLQLSQAGLECHLTSASLSPWPMALSVCLTAPPTPAQVSPCSLAGGAGAEADSVAWMLLPPLSRAQSTASPPPGKRAANRSDAGRAKWQRPVWVCSSCSCRFLPFWGTQALGRACPGATLPACSPFVSSWVEGRPTRSGPALPPSPRHLVLAEGSVGWALPLCSCLWLISCPSKRQAIGRTGTSRPQPIVPKSGTSPAGVAQWWSIDL